MTDSKALREALEWALSYLPFFESVENRQKLEAARSLLAAAPASPADSGASEPPTNWDFQLKNLIAAEIHAAVGDGQLRTHVERIMYAIEKRQPQPPAAVPSDLEASGFEAEMISRVIEELVGKELGWTPTQLWAIAEDALPIFHAVRAEADRPKIICLCGSTRFTDEMLEKSWELAKQGIIALGWNLLPSILSAESHGAEAEGVKEQIDELHKRKIDLADEVFVLNIGGYIGESTRSEINYAEAHGKPVSYSERKP